ncbi:MAG TPA: SDR family NAD(P)-dependent oxidoreductase [Solirubrobacterales bacterium]
MGNRLQDKVVVVTGAGQGMAREVCLRLTAEGAKVVGCDLNPDTAEKTLHEVREAGGETESLYPLDLRDEEKVHELMEFAADRYGGIDGLYNNAMAMRMGSIESLSLADWRETIDSTLTIHFLVWGAQTRFGL